MTTTVSLEVIQERIAYVTLNRPEAANALSRSLLHDLQEAIKQVNQMKDIRCTVITGSGEKAFCSGADLKERAGMSQEEVMETVHTIGRTIQLVENTKTPVLIAINGAAFGGGLELALAGDIRLVASSAKMGLTETSLGIIPGAGGTQRLPRLIGLGKAKELIFSAKQIGAKEAQAVGLVEHMVSPEQLQEETLHLASQIAANAPIALEQAKKAINQGMQVDITTGLTFESMCYQWTIPTQDRLEGLQAFKEKRRPEYKGE